MVYRILKISGEKRTWYSCWYTHIRHQCGITLDIQSVMEYEKISKETSKNIDDPAKIKAMLEVLIKRIEQLEKEKYEGKLILGKKLRLKWGVISWEEKGSLVFQNLRRGGKDLNVNFFLEDQTPIEIYDELVDKHYSI